MAFYINGYQTMALWLDQLELYGITGILSINRPHKISGETASRPSKRFYRLQKLYPASEHLATGPVRTIFKFGQRIAISWISRARPRARPRASIRASIRVKTRARPRA